ncbi:uncharacterized protein [Rutidosis leptorrhynchoides]|uniref:uncharacterized protein n=1 Tax=Rutidosis leptorrhynchoides TaxID=125765 RepID=UPI003A99D92B
MTRIIRGDGHWTQWNIHDKGAGFNHRQHQTLNTCIQRRRAIPQMVSIFIWRVKMRRIPTRSELDIRGIDLGTILCPLCNNDVESVDYVLIICPADATVCTLLLKLWDVDSQCISNIPYASANNQGFTNTTTGKIIWQARKWICEYAIWKHRNLKVFRKNQWSPNVIISDIQLHSFN